MTNKTSGIVYKPRESNKKNNLKHFSLEDLEFIKRELKDLLIYFGYASDKEGDESSHYCYAQVFSDAEKEKFKGYEELNQKTIDWVIGRKEEVEKLEYLFESKTADFEKRPILNIDFIDKLAQG